MRLQALVDKKKVVISETTIRDALRLDDAEGIECLPNEEIFVEVDEGANEGADEVHNEGVPADGVVAEGDVSAADDGRIIANMDADKDVILEDAKEVAIEKSADVNESTYVQGRKAYVARRRKGVVIRDPQESDTPYIIIHSEAKSKDNGKGILVEEPKPLKKQAQIEQDEAYARELEAELKKHRLG
nr:hypothetical protein [Tanacetum cinerariifolium]